MIATPVSGYASTIEQRIHLYNLSNPGEIHLHNVQKTYVELYLGLFQLFD